MLKDALDTLIFLSQKAAEPKPVESKNPRVTAWLTHDGNITEMPLPVPPRKHKVESLEDLIALAVRFDKTAAIKPDNPLPSPVVWYNAERVVLVIDDDGHRLETATLELVKSDQFKSVERLASGPWYIQKDFVRVLKIALIGALPPEALLNVVRRVKFENGTVVHGEIKKNRESMGKEIVAAVSAEGEIPDVVTLSVPVYKTFGLRDLYPVRCTVECDPMEGKFRLMPYPDEIEAVSYLALAKIEAALEADLPQSVPHYLGAP